MIKSDETNDDKHELLKTCLILLLIFCTPFICVFAVILLSVFSYDLSFLDFEESPHFDPSPDPMPWAVELTSADFALRILDCHKINETNIVFSPILITYDLGITYSMSRGSTNNRLQHLMLGQDKYGIHPVDMYNLTDSVIQDYFAPEAQSVPQIFLKREVYLRTDMEAKFNLMSRYQLNNNSKINLLEIIPEDVNLLKGEYDSWNLAPDAKVGETTWRLTNMQEPIITISSDLYCDIDWVTENDKSLSSGLAPFNTEDSNSMVPTACSHERFHAWINKDARSTIIRWDLDGDPGMQFWIIPTSSKYQSNISVTTDYMGHWFNEETKWQEANHVHFPCFTVTSVIDPKDVFRMLGANHAFDPEHAVFINNDGRNIYVDRFESSFTISVDENGISKNFTGEPVTQPLTCENPDVVVDGPFYFMLVNKGMFVLLGYIEEPNFL